MTIYIVTAGEYSDYGILAAFLDKTKAEQFVERYNRGVNYDSDKAEIEEYEEGVPFDFSTHDVYEVRFFDPILAKDRAPEIKKLDLNRAYGLQDIPRVVMSRAIYSSCMYIVTVAATNKNHAFKIACDALAKWKAEKEGL